MAVHIEILSKIPFFAALDEQALREVADRVHEVSIPAGQIVVLEGDPCNAVYFPVRGLLRTRRMSADGREQVLGYVGLGGCFNLVSALDGGANVATMDTLSEATIYVIPCQTFRRIVSEHQEVALAVSQYLAGEIRRLSDMVESLALHTVRSRLARFLLDRAEGKAPPRRWTQEEIASQIGTVREMVGRTLRAFTDEGWIRRERGRIVLVDRHGLEREAVGSEE
jgi:CRP/FNR family cyclic AMP-dependent transcriptional regulator